MNTKIPFILGIIMLGCFGFSYWLCRYAFFGLHGMKQWPNVLAIVGLITIVFSVIFRYQIIPIATIVGYMGGFILAMIFNVDGVDQGGGGTNNAWKIWGIVYILSILIGVILDFIRKQERKNVK
jgi:hypothetical protein